MAIIVKPEEAWETLLENHDKICNGGGAAIVLAKFEKNEHNYSLVGYFDDPDTDVVSIRLDEDFPEIEDFMDMWVMRHDEATLEGFLTGVYENFGEYIFDEDEVYAEHCVDVDPEEDGEEPQLTQKEIDWRNDEIDDALIAFLEAITDGEFDDYTSNLSVNEYNEYFDEIRERVLETLADLDVWVYAPMAYVDENGKECIDEYPYNAEYVTE
jgi:hypothetical protein